MPGMKKGKFSPSPSKKVNTDAPPKGKSMSAPKRHNPPGQKASPPGGKMVNTDPMGVVKKSSPGPAVMQGPTSKVKHVS